MKSEIIKESPEFRIDSEYYQKYYLKCYNIIESISNFLIKDFAYVTDGIHTSIEFDNQSNINLISAKSPKENYFDLSGNGYISRKQHCENTRTSLNNGDVIISTVGTIGNCAVVDDSILPANSDRHVGIIRIKKRYKPHYVSTFLLSKYGRFQTKRFITGNVQPNLFLDKIRGIKIPYISEAFQEIIERNVINALENFERSKIMFNKTHDFLCEKLKVNNFSAIDKNLSIKRFSECFLLSGRLDAEYYQSKYDALFDKLNELETSQLGGRNGLVNIQKSIEPGSEYYQEEGIPFVRVSDVDKFEISMSNIRLPHDIIANVEKLYLKKDTILLSKDGSVGIAYKVQEDMEAITSGALLHLTVKNANVILPDYLTLVLNSPIVQLQAERDSNGAIIRHWKPSDIEKVIIPVLGMDIQKHIAEKVQESFRLRNKSKRLLELVVKTVETAIETDEEVAINWLESQM